MITETGTRILVVFDTRHGQSERIAEHVSDLCRRAGHEARAVHRALVGHHVPISAYTAVIAIAPVYFGHHPGSFRRFLRRSTKALMARPFAFVSVGNAAVSRDPARRAEATDVARRLLEDLALPTGTIVAVAGAIAYPEYGRLERWLVRAIAEREGAPTDPSRTYELTSWPTLDAGLAPFLEGLPRAPATVADQTAATAPTGGAGARPAVEATATG